MDRRQLQRPSGAKIAQMAAAYQDGKSVYELAFMFDVHRTTVGVILRRHGVTAAKPAIHIAKLRKHLRLQQGCAESDH
ncbi:MAG: hypothetical protein LBJ08_02105 [Bifidobacteriaceae bacterium]|nr:hypothetical protein [Bifidobacteriaceae bacterium]